MGAETKASFNLLKALKQVLSNTNGTSLLKKLVRGLSISEKFLMDGR